MSIIKQTHRDAIKELFGKHYSSHLQRELNNREIFKSNGEEYEANTIKKVLCGTLINYRIGLEIIKIIQEKRLEIKTILANE